MRSEIVVLVLAVSAAAAGTEQKFYPDDPIWVDPELEDASGVEDRDVAEGYDFIANSLLELGDSTKRRAVNVNTLDEVPDSSWFTNRVGVRELTVEDVARGPDTGGPRPGPWQILSSKTAGITPGLTMRDASGQLYFVKFDPPGNLEMASAAEVITTKILHAAGYNVPENYVVRFRREDLIIEGARFASRSGRRRRPMVEEDLDRLLAKVAANPDGSYRAMASKAVSGQPVGAFRYYGTRADDPNDVFPHEHRRELRALRVFAAWVNNADSRGLNSIDTLVDEDGREVVRHYLLDFGSALGSAAIAIKSRRSGNEYIWNITEGFVQIGTLGLKVPDWTRVDFPDVPSVGRFESEFFQPERFKPHYPNPAFDNAQPDDLFWGARRVMAFTDEMIAALVHEGQFTDPQAETYLTHMLIERRNKIGRAWLTVVNPLVHFELDPTGRLSFDNAAVAAGAATEPEEYQLDWFLFDNDAGSRTPLASPQDAPVTARFLEVEVRTEHPDYPHWQKPVRAYFRRRDALWETVGLEH